MSGATATRRCSTEETPATRYNGVASAACSTDAVPPRVLPSGAEPAGCHPTAFPGQAGQVSPLLRVVTVPMHARVVRA
jgi:hypothetical protein